MKINSDENPLSIQYLNHLFIQPARMTAQTFLDHCLSFRVLKVWSKLLSPMGSGLNVSKDTKSVFTDLTYSTRGTECVRDKEKERYKK